MAVSVCIVRSNLSIFCLFLSVISVSLAENTTSGLEQNSTSGFTESPTEIPTQSSSLPTERPPVAAEPLPVSRSLPAPVTGADRLCPCDHHTAGCDWNCCCDRGCRQEAALFTSCWVSAVRSGSQQLCSQDVAHYSLSITSDGYSELQSSLQKETNYDILCIQAQNRLDGLSHLSPPLPTDSNFDSLFSRFVSFVFGSEVRDELQPADVQSSSGYQMHTQVPFKFKSMNLAAASCCGSELTVGDVLATAAQGGQRGIFYLPAPGVTSDCMNSPAAFLKDQGGRCSWRLVLDGGCSSVPALRMDTYTNIYLFAGRNQDAAVVPVELASVVLRSVEGVETEPPVSDGVGLLPVLINPSLCANVVLKVDYVITYSSAGDLLNASVSLVLGFVSKSEIWLQQEFQLIYIQDGGERGVHYSGNPGYVVGMPLMSGDRSTDGISRSMDLRDTLSLLQSSGEQDCLHGPHQRSPVLFALDSVSGCMLRLEDISNCSLVSQLLLDVLRGPNSPQYVASFGNSPLENVQDWVPVKTSMSPTEAQSCNIPLSLHLEIEWTKYGTLLNPQAQILNVREVIQTNRSSLATLSGASSILPIRSSVSFIPVSAAALPGYRATPSINAKLPFDFFLPFV